MMTKAVNLKLDLNKRLLFISDIHGDIAGLKKLLQKVNFTDNDYLIILGDMIEKSNDSIAMLDFMMGLSLKENVYIVMGNCDNVVLNLKGEVDENLLRYYALKRKKTIINDFAAKLGVTIDYDTDIKALCKLFQIHFKKYFDFIEQLPQVLIFNGRLACVHGGIDDIDNLNLDALSVMKYDDFYEKAPNPLKIPLIVGHFPTINYTYQIPKINPIIDLNKNIISIDGGNNLVPWCQLNCLIVSNLETLNFSYEYVDKYEEVMINKDTKTLDTVSLYNITKTPKAIDIIKENGDFYYVKVENKYFIYVLKEEVFYESKTDRMMAYNGFNYFMPLKKGDKVKLVLKREPYSIIKKEGIISLVLTKDLGD